MQSAMQRLSSGMQNQSCQSCQSGMSQLGQRLGQEGKKQGCQSCLSHQLSQLGAFRQGMCDGDKPGSCLSLYSALSFEVSQRESNSAGNATNYNRYGGETEMSANRTREEITGQMGLEGEMEVKTIAAETGQAGGISGSRNADIAHYEELSREAIENENLPIAYRQAIRRYFESIRPEER